MGLARSAVKRAPGSGLCLLTVSGKIKAVALLLAFCGSDNRKLYKPTAGAFAYWL